ncbi:MAG: radical SAM protein [Oscillospiraceae bacterium]|jgi:putative methyltransferase|nr:radical SAM protein [Oscillospiraceae bacterium]
MKNVYFVQANYLFGNNAHLPYAVGCLAAYAWQNQTIAQNYHLGRFIYTREKTEQAAQSLESPFFVGFSCYVWNMEYNKTLARRVKELYPDCWIVFGGHQVPTNDASLLDELAFVDFLLHGAGEVAFERLLLALLDRGDLSGVPNLSYRLNGSIIQNQIVPQCPVEFPSPYLTGIFDELYASSPYAFSMSFETNRGCPFHCAFCDWGTLHGKIYEFPMERIEAEIAWAAAHQTDLLYCVDANFGILPRDTAIAEKIIASKQKTGFPRKFRACYTKNSDETVYHLNRRLHAFGLSKGATLSFQSVEPEVLENIGRKNLTLERFRELMILYNRAGIPTDSELIIGLPGETLRSFRRGVGKLLEAGQHHSLDIYLCELFPNSELARPEIRTKFGIQSVLAPLRRDHSREEDDEEVCEYGEIIIQTASMNRDDWKHENLFAILVQALHCNGATQLLAMFAYYVLDVPYDVFYQRLLEWSEVRPAHVLGKWIAYFSGSFDELMAGRGARAYINRFFGNMTWPLEEGLFLETARQIDRFACEIKPFLAEIGFPPKILDELLRYQLAMLKLPRKVGGKETFAYDFPRLFAGCYAQEPEAIQKRQTTIIVPNTQQTSWEEYARVNVWYGRRGGSNILSPEEVGYAIGE